MDEHKYRIRMNERAIKLLMHKDEYDPRYLELGVHDYSDHALLNELEKRVHPLSEKSNQCLEGGKEPCPIRKRFSAR